jgi:alpha-mannosidase
MAKTQTMRGPIREAHDSTATFRWSDYRQMVKCFHPVVLVTIFFVLLVHIPPLHAQAKPPAATPYDPVLTRLQAMSVQSLPDWKAHYDDIAHGEDPGLDDTNWAPVHLMEGWGNGPAWFRRWVEVPRALGGYDIRGARVRLDLRAGAVKISQARVFLFLNGSLAGTGDWDTQQPILLTNNGEPGMKVLVAINIPAASGPAWVASANLVIDYPESRPDPGLIADEIRSAYAFIAGVPEGKSEREQQLEAAVKTVDFAALDRGDQPAFEQSLRATQDQLQPLGNWAKQFTVRAVGESHIDISWLWPWTETVEIVRNTFTTVLQLMRQYPSFTYTQSSAQAFVWMEEKYPDMFKEIQQRVKEGRWEMVGGMWVEPDLNLPSGESLVRQVVIGKRYFQEKFGVDVKIEWNPDSFGYSWQLPQIYKRSGIKYFIDGKLGMNDTTKFPYRLFWWESPDGSRVLSYFPHSTLSHFDHIHLDRGRISSFVADDHTRTGLSEIMLTYGVGDHGGGPTRTLLDSALRWQNGPNVFPKLTFSTAQSFFDDVTKNQDRLKIPVWKNELYLQETRGVYTTQAETKKRMRQSEELLLNAEKFSSLAMLDGHPYPQPEFEDDWQKVLFEQHHGILPGVGIAINYVDAARSLHQVSLSGHKILSKSLGTLVARINTQGAGVPVVLFNPLSWTHTGITEVRAQFPSKVGEIVVRDASGAVLPSAVISRDEITHTLKIRLLAKSVPALGYTVIHLVPVPKAASTTATLKAGPDGMENEFLRIKVNSQTGCITSLFNKQDDREALAPRACANLLQTFVDLGDSWHLGKDFENKMWNLTDAEEVKLVENTPLRAVIRVKKKFQSSSFIQDICMYPGVRRVDVNMQADWHEKHILLKVAFPVSVQSDFATYEIPYGNIQRPTTRNTPEEKAMFEVPALQWGDLSDLQHGLSILNDCKYGYDAKGNVIRLTLLRSTEDPDPHADEGFHEFTYALYPHRGDWKAGETERRGYELNFPLIPVTAQPHAGILPASRSLVQIEPGNVILTAVKKAEDSDALVFRFFEFEGKAADVRLRFPQAATQAAQVNLMEKQDAPLTLREGGKETTLTVHPYEIVTVKAEFAKVPSGGTEQ